MMSTASYIPIILVVLIVVTILKSVKALPQGMEYTVERVGRYTKTLRPGLSFIIPFVDNIDKGFPSTTRERALATPSTNMTQFREHHCLDIEGRCPESLLVTPDAALCAR